MATFRFADGRVEQHPVDPRAETWRLLAEQNGADVLLFDPDVSAEAFDIPVLTFKQVRSGEFWQVDPERFDPFAALRRQDERLERIKEEARRLTRWVPCMDGMVPAGCDTDPRAWHWVRWDELCALLDGEG